jgi:hypothetical protein
LTHPRPVRINRVVWQKMAISVLRAPQCAGSSEIRVTLSYARDNLGLSIVINHLGMRLAGRKGSNLKSQRQDAVLAPPAAPLNCPEGASEIPATAGHRPRCEPRRLGTDRTLALLFVLPSDVVNARCVYSTQIEICRKVATARLRRHRRGAEPIWFASYPPGIPRTIDPDSYPSLTAMLLDACVRHGDHPAFECLGCAHELYRLGSRQLQLRGVSSSKRQCRPGDRVAIMLPNLLAYPVAFLGALRAGLSSSTSIRSTRRANSESACGFGRHHHRDHGEFRAQARIRAGRDANQARGGGAARRFHAGAQTRAVSILPTLIRRAVPAWHFEDLHNAANGL